MAYDGWLPCTSSPTSQRILTLDCSSEVVSVDQFTHRFIYRRQPVLLKNFYSASEIQHLTSHLEDGPLDPEVDVERRYGDQFGGPPSTLTRMSFKDLLIQLKSGARELYLSAQQRDDTAENMQMLAQSLTAKSSTLMSHLEFSSANIWMGFSKEGTSSGLHHDFHDNMYSLLQGRKRFKLFPPTEAFDLDTVGSPLHVSWNGLVEYEETTVNQNVSLLESIERKIESAQKRVDTGISGADEELEDAESQLDAYLDDMLEPTDEDSDENFPNHFCNSSEQTSKDLNGERNARLCICELEKGDVLFLPSGWFHEVTSASCDSYHLALNHWYFPPKDRQEEPKRQQRHTK